MRSHDTHNHSPRSLREVELALPVFTATSGNILMNDHIIRLKGASWFGAEGSGKVPNGLWLHNVSFYLEFLSRNEFNAIRLPFALDNYVQNSFADRGMLQMMPELQGQPFVHVLDYIIEQAAKYGLLVLLDLQRLKSTRWPDDGLWYSKEVPEEATAELWEQVAQQYCNRWNVLGVDILNEPWGARWRDWARAASRLGNSVLSRCSRWVIFVEGVAHEGVTRAGEFFWGENLVNAGNEMVNLMTPHKLVYSPHVYGPGDGSKDHHMPYFDMHEFPTNLPRIWDRHFGYLAARKAAPVVVGEWGGIYTGKDRLWQDEFLRYLTKKQLSSFYWALNPNSGDTGGLLQSDWTSPEEDKLTMLRSLPSTKISPLISEIKAFKCPDAQLRRHFHQCSDLAANECILKEQVCNGRDDCGDRSDEIGCAMKYSCRTISSRRKSQPCIFPFSYNGFEYDRCTLVDALDLWTSLGVGRCQRGYIPGLDAHGLSLDQCQQTCLRTPNCTHVSFTGVQQYCSYHTSACGTNSLNQASSDYVTYQFNDGGGAWCATSVGQEREYLGLEHAGTCGPSCARPQPVNELERSRCHSSASALNGGFAHCAPSPSPPPHPPVLPPPPPPGLPPSNPPPVIELLISILPDLTVVLVGCACLTASLCRCLYWACCPCWSRRYRRGRPREIDATELQALAGTRMDNNWLEPKATRQSLKVGERLRR